MGLDVNEIASNSIVGLVLAVVSFIGASISRFIGKVNKAERDLNAVFPKIRAIETKLDKGCCNACRSIREVRAEALDRGIPSESYHLDALGDQPKDDDVPA